jgi:hypothetical protein
MPQKPIAIIGPYFAVLVWIITSICFLSLVGIFCLALAAPDPLSKAQEVALETSKYAFTTTLGAIVGLLGGRASTPNYVGELPGRARKS